ncbi:MAG: transglutaminase-like domain-containing protein [Nevskia sp.]|nr:transglutaminase-like domain-containing protein [Nevskia sp.]
MLVLEAWACEASGSDANAQRQAAQALDRWISQGLPFERNADGERVFDPAEALNFGIRESVHRGDPFWLEHYVPQRRRLVCEFHPGAAAGELPTAALGTERFNVTLRRDFNLAGHEPGTRVRLRLPVPLEDETLRDLTVVGIAPDDQQVDFARRPGRLDAQLTVPPSQTVSLAVQASFVALGSPVDRGPAALAPSDRELYTRSSEGLVQVSPRIRALAVQIADAQEEPWHAVGRFWDFLQLRVMLGMVRYEDLDRPYPTDWALETGWANCHLASALLVALCRARKIPARVVAGYPLYPPTPCLHYWVEIWMEAQGWLPFDTLSLDLSGRDHEAFWRNYFFGRLDYRMKTQCLPRLFDAQPDLRFPAAWHHLGRCITGGAEASYIACESGQLIYREQVTVQRVPQSAISAQGHSGLAQ